MSVLLRAGTKDAHTQAERRPFVRAWLSGRLTLKGYRFYLAALYPVYEVLEALIGAQQQQGHPWFVGFDWSVLARQARLRADIAALDRYIAYGEGGQPVNAVAEPYGHPANGLGEPYAQRVAASADGTVASILGHAYCRYLGDLAGGQLLARATRKLGVPPEAMTAYRFEGEPASLAAAFKRRLDELSLSTAARTQALAAAQDGFECTMRIFDETIAMGSASALKVPSTPCAVAPADPATVARPRRDSN